MYAPEPDPELKVIRYKRNYEQNEILGLNDMKTENYENDSWRIKIGLNLYLVYLKKYIY